MSSETTRTPDFNASDRSAEPISVALNALSDASIVAEQTRGYLGGSAIGHECLRRIQFDWMCDPEHPARLRDIFDRGHYFKSEAGESAAVCPESLCAALCG